MEDKFIIEGGARLSGSVSVSGSKNASLPLLAASLLTPEKCVLSGIPDLSDINNMLKMLDELGAQVNIQGSQVTVQSRDLHETGHLQRHVKKMRASFLLLAPMLVRIGEACLPLPGGCAIGSRPVDLHLEGLAALGAKIQIEENHVRASARQLKGCEINLAFPSVGATENIMMAAAAAQGCTTIVNAAAEPEIVDLAVFLNKMGARVCGAGTPLICIEGNPELRGAVHTVIPDRVEAGTYLIAALATGGEVHLARVIPDHLRPVLEGLRQAGALIEEHDEAIFAAAPRKFKPLEITTAPYPGFPTDMQPQFAALLATACGESTILETVFENRFLYVDYLQKMGADIQVADNCAFIRGVDSLQPALVEATDLRAGAALVVAALKACGKTELDGVYHLDRGYENLEEKLTSLGARIQRVAAQAVSL